MPAITFHQSGKERLVWNPATGKAAAEFLGGEFTTDNEKVQQLLSELGYRTIQQVRAGAAEAALQMPVSRKEVVPSTEAAGAAASVSIEPRNRQEQTAFEAPDPGEAQAAGIRPSGPQPAPKAAKQAKAKRVV